MLITANQILCHLIGDYLFQNTWMAMNKVNSWFVAAVHATVYTIPFLIVTQAPAALAFILGTHCIIDRFRLARYVMWAVNGFKQGALATGYPEQTPPWLSTWLLIIVDNTFHITLNGVGIYLLGNL